MPRPWPRTWSGTIDTKAASVRAGAREAGRFPRNVSTPASQASQEDPSHFRAFRVIPPMPQEPDRTVLIVRKHHVLVRWTHWLNVPLLFGLIASGLAIYWAGPVFKHAPDPVTGSRDYLADLGHALGGDPRWLYDHVSLGTGQLAGALRLHWFLAYFFMLNGVLYLVGLAKGGGWRALVPRPSD